MLKNRKIPAVIFIITAFLAVSFFLSSCSSPLFIPGASIGYYISQDNEGRIHIMWSADKKDNNFIGSIRTDGIFEELGKEAIEEDDLIEASENEIIINANLSAQDYYDEIIISAQDYSYIEFDLKLNGQYDLSRINIGKFINNPSEGTFRLPPDYFEKLKSEPLLKNHPFSEFLRKLYSTRIMVFIYFFIIGTIIIEILRITKYNSKPRKKLYISLSYIALLLIDAGFFMVLVFTNGN